MKLLFIGLLITLLCSLLYLQSDSLTTKLNPELSPANSIRITNNKESTNINHSASENTLISNTISLSHTDLDDWKVHFWLMILGPFEFSKNQMVEFYDRHCRSKVGWQGISLSSVDMINTLALYGRFGRMVWHEGNLDEYRDRLQKWNQFIVERHHPPNNGDVFAYELIGLWFDSIGNHQISARIGELSDLFDQLNLEAKTVLAQLLTYHVAHGQVNQGNWYIFESWLPLLKVDERLVVEHFITVDRWGDQYTPLDVESNSEIRSDYFNFWSDVFLLRTIMRAPDQHAASEYLKESYRLLQNRFSGLEEQKLIKEYYSSLITDELKQEIENLWLMSRGLQPADMDE